MAYTDQTDPKLPIPGQKSTRQSAELLPKFFRTQANKKFLQSTIDQFISEGTVDKINGYIGRQTSKAHRIDDIYVDDVSIDRKTYQLEPALVIRDFLGNVDFFKDYNDYIDQIFFFNGDSSNHNILNSQEYYSWDAHIDWDKFVNYREYYWLPNGPQTVGIYGQQENIVSTYTVTLSDEIDNIAFVFTPDGLKKNPSLRLYRGQTYRFEINCPGQPFLIKSDRTTGLGSAWGVGVVVKDVNGIEIDEIAIEQGTIEFTIPQEAPNVLYYVSKNDVNSSGLFKIYDIVESTKIDVEKELLGKKTYAVPTSLADLTTSVDQTEVLALADPSLYTVPLSNGMKIFFQGQVVPEKYSQGFWYVEGVGTGIYLVAESDLETPGTFASNKNIEFDNENFDSQGFDVNKNFPGTKDYIVINRGSKDRNPWSRYNRWFHKDVIETSALLNNQTINLDQTARAVRPIIEFNAGLELMNFGRQAKENVTLVDTFTSDVFSIIEGSQGYNIDGVDLAPGMRVLFTNDPDPLVRGRIFKVSFITHLNIRRITLIEEADSIPQEGETVLVLEGTKNSGKMFYYEEGQWTESQSKTALNQQPLFDVFDEEEVSFSDRTKYPGSTFTGTKLFSYRPGTVYDTELGFAIAYKNIGNLGDIVFDYNYHSDSFIYQDLTLVRELNVAGGFLRSNKSLTAYNYLNGWTTAESFSSQPVIQTYDVTGSTNFFEINSVDNATELTDLEVRVYVNSVRQRLTDYTLAVFNGKMYVQFYANLTIGDRLIIKLFTDNTKNDNGFYEFPTNLQNNPDNENVSEFTLGEIIDHVSTMVDNNREFYGSFPGTGNLRDLGNVTKFGSKIIQSSSTLSPVIYHIADKKHNVVNAIRQARTEYNKFKKNFIRTITDFGFDGETRVHVDLVLENMFKDKLKTDAYYLSDMIPVRSTFIYEQEVIDDSIVKYPLTFDFNLAVLSEKAVLVYVNEQQLLHGRDYVFEDDNFIRILSGITTGDNLKLVQYETTDGCYVPPTPSKLGIYPVYEPQIYVDTTYQTPTRVIQGHDGSIIVAFDDYRDDLILELEKRIFNNIKVSYDPSIFDIDNYIGGYYREVNVDIEATQRQDFLQWSQNITGDFTKQDYYDVNNSFTYNYSKTVGPDLTTQMRGFWRGVYKFFYDTDRPHTHPWEMLGFRIKPQWWENLYGPAPYTRDNLVLWNDIANGIIRVPGRSPESVSKYARPTILSHLPVDNEGVLLSPLDSGLVKQFSQVLAKSANKFGDMSPIETAWRRSPEFPFSVIAAIVLNRPADAFSRIFDRSRQKKDLSGQLVYDIGQSNIRFSTKNIVYPNTVNESERRFTSGLANFINEYVVGFSQDEVTKLKTNLTNLKVHLASKLGGFTNKDKFKLILDSRSPLSQGNVFIPQENYQIVVNTSAPITYDIYSGVIIEKIETGFVVRGYSKSIPEFKYFRPVEIKSDPVINVGGISEEFVEWNAGKYYSKGTIVRFSGDFFRTLTDHESSSTFEIKYFSRLSSLPIVGGKTAFLRKTFNDDISYMPYGAVLTSDQEVVDFLLGYGKYLESRGFKFEYFNTSLNVVTNWATSVKEFLFWTTQNWGAGTILTLSPAAQELKYGLDYSVVDNIYDSFYDYAIYKSDGNILDPTFTNSYREFNEFTLQPRNTADGIYHAQLNPVQKEHVLILDDVSIFNDVIYDKAQGYRQERIKVLGYKTSDWNGDFEIPGFVYDKAIVKEWTPWTDYPLGETVKYKEFYYSARTNVPGTENFNPISWYKLSKRPESKLIPNWDYKANQFPDFYDLDSDSFDSQQQKFAQHIIGYQKRQYLENIINNDVSQYKFYQGMIQEKGTQNSLLKLFDALNSADKESLEFYEEWAIRLSQYGGVALFDEIEYTLDENKFLINPQPVELVTRRSNDIVDLIYRIEPHEVYLKNDGYNHRPFPIVFSNKKYVQDAGYVSLEDIQFTVVNKADLLEFDLTTLQDGDYVWVGFDPDFGKGWNVYRFTLLNLDLISLEFISETKVKLNFSSSINNLLEVGGYIGITSTDVDAIDGTKVIESVDVSSVTVQLTDSISETDVDGIDIDSVILHTFISNRFSNVDRVNALDVIKKKPNELAWVDDFNGKWSLWKYSTISSPQILTLDYPGFSRSIEVLNDNTLMLSASKFDKSFLYQVTPGDPTTNEYRTSLIDCVYLLSRVGTAFPWSVISRIEFDDPYQTVVNLPGLPATRTVFKGLSIPDQQELIEKTTKSFGDSLAISNDGQYLLIGAPDADTDTLTSAGYVALYKYTGASYVRQHVFVSPTPVSGERFGSNISMIDNVIYISASGSEGVDGSLYLFYADTYSPIGSFTDSGINITSMSVAANGTAVVGSSDENVTVYFDAANNPSGPSTQVITVGIVNSAGVDFEIPTGSNFGTSVDISEDASRIAIGIPYYSEDEYNQGAVVILSLVDGEYVVTQTIRNFSPRANETFGSFVELSDDGNKLIVMASGGVQIYEVPFDDGAAVFDSGTTTFFDDDKDASAVYTYEIYDQKFVFGDSIEVGPSIIDNPDTAGVVEKIGKDFAKSIEFTDRIYINDPQLTLGHVFEFEFNPSWSVYKQEQPTVDVSKIKSVFLYNKTSNEIVEKLDWVDPLRGKILGVAEQELSFKTYYDPASYSVGTETVTVDPDDPWLEKNVGLLWWNLRSVKFIDYAQASTLYKANTWNTVFPDTEIEVLEWVRSDLLPSEWDAQADTEEGLTLGISGTSLYGDSVYSLRREFDSISKTFNNVYYFWVKNKKTTPAVPNRMLSASDVADAIQDPKTAGYKYIAFLSDSAFSLVNCKELLIADNIALNIKLWNADNKDVPVHGHYQLLSENDPNSRPNKYVEKKWFDSLIGFDEFNRPVPDTTLPPKIKYGILSKPRQSMFINRIEALKQFVERANSILASRVTVDDFDLSPLEDKDEPPSIATNAFDQAIDTYAEIRFISSRSLRLATLSPVIVDGKLVKVNILNPGYGYKTAPTVRVTGSGSGAVLKTEINSDGEITSVTVVKTGSAYTTSTYLTVRPFTVLINTDETAVGKWALYTWDYNKQQWFRARTQKYDTTKYWQYADWYAAGYSIFTKPDFIVDFSYQINFLSISIGQTVKILNQGSGGWLLLEKINNEDAYDITVGYKVVGRQNGTIQIKDNVYRFVNNNVGFDGPTFDNDLFDNQPKEELRIILNCLKDNILIDDLAIEYNKLFFASLRYVFNEQLFVDWAFKTSFVKSKHNLGQLTQKITYQSDNLSSYEDYVNEVKPYRTKVREFVSAYERLENTNTNVTDFDLPSRYNPDTNLIEPIKTLVTESGIFYDSDDILVKPYNEWLNNVGYSVTDVYIVDAGSGYFVAPQLTVLGLCARPAELVAYVSKGRITSVKILDPGEGYIQTPTIVVDGSVDEGGSPGSLTAVLGNSLVRSQLIGVKFDRINPTNTITENVKTQEFTGTGSQTLFALKWPVDIKTNKTVVTVDNEEKLSTEYSVYNVLDTSASYTRYKGYLQFDEPPESTADIVIQYTKDINLLDAADRIEYYYETAPGKLGKDLGQLMQGVDYGGVELTGISFDIGAGWDALPWFTGGWDGFDPDFDDYLIRSDGTTRTFTLPYIPNAGTAINIYLNNVRIDDPYFDLYDGSTVQENGRTTAPSNAVMNSFVGDGETDQVELPGSIDLDDGDILVFRKTTSDGSFRPDTFVYDTELSGGNLSYTSAQGINPEDIVVDGDGFVTPMSSHAPEEIVTGQVMDTVDITVYHKRNNGSAMIVTRHYIVDGNTDTFDVGQRIMLASSVFVKKDGLVLKQAEDFTVEVDANTVTLTVLPANHSEIVVTSVGIAASDILDSNEFIGDGETAEFVTSARWSGDTTVFVTVNGEAATIEKFITDETYDTVGNIGFAFFTPPEAGDIISYLVLGSEVDSISKVTKQDITLTSGVSTYSLNSVPRNLRPFDNNALVEINGHILRPRDTIYFDVDGSNRVFTIDIADYPYSSINAQDLEVFINGNKSAIGLDFVWNTTNNQITMRVGRVQQGDKLAVSILTDREYQIIEDAIVFTNDYATDTVATVTTFSNHDILDVERNNDRLRTESSLTPGTASYYKFKRLSGGRIDLRRPVVSAEYVWISLDNELLTPNVDYVLEENLRTIRISRAIQLTGNEILDIVCFDSNISRESFAYKIFKDILNRTHYKRVDDTVTTELAAQLNSYDYTITVADASGLAEPNPESNIPGILFIDRERIEYFTKTGNVLGQLRRGTLGTGVKSVYSVGTAVRDAGEKQTVPYKDETETLIYISDGSSNIVSLDSMNFIPRVKTGTTEDSWYRDTIPEGYGQCDEVEVFVAGRRLNKAPRIVFDPELGPYSPSGDYQVEAEFSVDGINSEIRLTETPETNTKIIVQRRIGRSWILGTDSLKDSETAPAKFIRSKRADLPK